MRKPFLFASILVFVEIAAAQIPTSGNVFFGYSYLNTNLNGDRNSLNGWEGSVEAKVLPHIGLVADFSGHYGSETFRACNGFDCVIFDADVTQNNYLFGPRVSASFGKIRPFAELLIGASHVHIHALDTDTSFATGVGGGLDYRFLKILAWRMQGDYIHTSPFHTPQNNVRLSTGIVVRF
jgi:hypothetical protein